MNIGDLLKPYRDYKSIFCDLVTVVKNTELNCSENLYRGDCIYETFLKVGDTIKFYNNISSWTSDISIAERFSNKESMPEWYFMEDEWCGDNPYPFKNLDENTIKPVVFKIKDINLKGLRVADYIDVENDTEYVRCDEKEYVLGNDQFLILDIKNNNKYLLVTVTSNIENTPNM